MAVGVPLVRVYAPGIATVCGPVTPFTGCASIVRDSAAVGDNAAICPRPVFPRAGNSVAPASRLPHLEQYAR